MSNRGWPGPAALVALLCAASILVWGTVASDSWVCSGEDPQCTNAGASVGSPPSADHQLPQFGQAESVGTAAAQDGRSPVGGRASARPKTARGKRATHAGPPPEVDTSLVFPVPLSPQHTVIDGVQEGKGALLVLEDKTKGWKVLVTSRSILGGQWLDTEESIFSSFAVMAASMFARPDAKSYLAVGLGTGSAITAVQSAERIVDVVEISHGVVDMAKKHFDFKPNGEVYVQDALDFYQSRIKDLKDKVTTKKYDIILQDTFNGDGTDPKLIAKETLRKVKRLLNKGGLFVFNFVGYARGTKKEMAATLSVHATLRSVFAHVRAFLDFGLSNATTSELRNIVFFASDEAISFCLPPEIAATGADQEKDPNLIYNHFQEWELLDWTPVTRKGRPKATPSASTGENEVITLRKADLFRTQQQPLQEAYWRQVHNYVPSEIWGIANKGLYSA